VLTRPGPPSARVLTRAAVASSCFLLARPLSPFFWAVVVVAVLAMALTRARLRELAADRAARIAGGAVVLAGLIAGGWYLWSGNGESAGKSGVTISEAAGHSFRHIPTLIQQMVGVFGWLDTPTPETLTRVWVGAVIAVAIAALVVGSGRQRLVLVATGVALFAIPIAIEAAGAEQFGYFWQGRYSLPLVVGIPLLASWTVAAAERFPRRVAVGLAVVIGAGLAVEQFIAHGTALSRYVRGGPTSFLAYRHGGPWDPRLPVLVLFGVAAVGFGAYGAWVALVGSSEPPGYESASAPASVEGAGSTTARAPASASAPATPAAGSGPPVTGP
jgi:hypothetical protein